MEFRSSLILKKTRAAIAWWVGSQIERWREMGTTFYFVKYHCCGGNQSGDQVSPKQIRVQDFESACVRGISE